MRLEATKKNVRGGLNKPSPSQVGLSSIDINEGQPFIKDNVRGKTTLDS